MHFVKRHRGFVSACAGCAAVPPDRARTPKARAAIAEPDATGGGISCHLESSNLLPLPCRRCRRIHRARLADPHGVLHAVRE